MKDASSSTAGKRREWKKRFLFPAESRPMIWAGLLTSRVRPDAASRFAFPGVAEWHVKQRPSLTVAGPRRIRTGFPVRPVMGAQTRHGITMIDQSARRAIEGLDGSADRRSYAAALWSGITSDGPPARVRARNGGRQSDMLGWHFALGAHEGITGKPVQFRRGPATVSEDVSLRLSHSDE